jgi:hypothetical protein
MTGHSVRLPHPDAERPTVAACDAGDWTITYQWGGHDDAVSQASDHVGEATSTHPVEAPELGGDRLVVPGLSR